MNNKHVLALAAVLASVGLLIFAFKTIQIGFPLSPGEMADAWRFERQIEFEASGGPVKLIAKIPASSSSMTVVRERIVAKHYGATHGTQGVNKTVTLATRNARGPQVVYLNTAIHRVKGLGMSTKSKRPMIERPNLQGPELSTAMELLENAERRSADDETLVSALLQAQPTDTFADTPEMSKGGNAAMANKADATVTILALRGLPARRVNGLDMRGDSRLAKLIYWLEVYLDDRWTAYSQDGRTKHFAGIPSDLVRVRTDAPG